ncbi:MAG: hypothetical protein RLZZ175_2577 [Bacteroidota bacterium]|jgi:chitinase
MNYLKFKLLIFLIILISLESNAQMRVIGYFPSWKPELIETLPYEQLTHINFAFLSLYPDGSLRPFEKNYELEQVVKKAHAKGVKVLISVGGWELGDGGGVDDAFEIMASKSKSRKRFVKQLSSFLDSYSLDGADIDWEFPDQEQSGIYFDSLMRELNNELAPKNKLLTVAVVPSDYHGKHILSSSLQYLDFLNIMAYDGGTPHSSYEYAVESFNYWKIRGMSSDKIVIGVPFYGRHETAYMGYNEILSADPTAYDKDIFNSIEYNGAVTIKKKAQFAKQNAGGIMIWELSQDVFGPKSLLKVIYDIKMQ